MVPPNEEFCLKWDDFQQNISTSFRELLRTNDFSDVTLVGEDGQEIKTHRVILSASSTFFHNILLSNKHSHLMIYMRGMKQKYLQAILDFIYQGEANVYQDDLDDFFLVAEEFQL